MMFDGLCAIHKLFKEYSSDQLYIKVRRAIFEEKNKVYNDDLERCYRYIKFSKNTGIDSQCSFNMEDEEYSDICEDAIIIEISDAGSDYSLV